MTTRNYYKGSEAAIRAAIAQIDANCGFGTPDYPTVQTWYIPQITKDGDYIAIAPLPNGWNGYTKAEMTVGVALLEVDFDPTWFPEE